MLFVLSHEFGWSPQQISLLTLKQIKIYLSQLARHNNIQTTKTPSPSSFLQKGRGKSMYQVTKSSLKEFVQNHKKS